MSAPTGVAQCAAVSDPRELTRRPHRLILPLGMRVLVRIIRDQDRTDSGLYLPAGAKEAQDEALYGEVVEVARDRPTSDDVAENVSGVPHGARVLFRKDAGVRVPWDEALEAVSNAVRRARAGTASRLLLL